MTRFTVAFGLVMAGVTSAWAWGPEGHEIIGAIAEMHLTPQTRASIAGLIGPDQQISDSHIANWPDFIRRDAPGTAPWHFVDIPFDAKAYVPSHDCRDGQCVIGAIGRFLEEVRDPHVPLHERVDALKFVVHFVGDVHQPLHCIDRDEDRGGNLRTVHFPGHDKDSNLHRVWDEDLVRECLAGRPVKEYAQLLNERVTPAEQREWVQGTVADWAWETHRLAVEHAYKNIPEGGPPVELTHAYVAENGHIVEQQLTKAGLRLAFLLNKAFAP